MTLHTNQHTVTNWLFPSTQPTLNGEQVAVWRVFVDQEDERTYWSLLAHDEQVRAKKFRFARDRKVSVVARGILRTLIGRYLQRPPADLTFSYSKFGKPTLATDDTLHFNVSHSGNLILIAFARNRAIGVDVEQYRPLSDLADIAQSFFSPLERTMLFALPDVAQQAAFFRLWSRKEAFIKERGEGLSHPLHSFDVSLAVENADLIATRHSDINPDDYTISSIKVADKYEAALAITGKQWHTNYFTWHEKKQLMNG